MKTKEQVLNWVDYMLKSNLCMNVEDRNMLNAIKYYIAEKQTNGDLISRKDLLKELEKWDWQDTYLPIHFAELVADLPSAEKTAEWIIKHKVTNSGSFWENICSNCGKESDSVYNYCPNCGAIVEKAE